MDGKSSSRERRIRLAKRRLVLDVFLTRGATWKHIQDMRKRWGIETQPQLPYPRSHGIGPYLPESLGPKPQEEFGEQAERWSAGFQGWTNDLAALYKVIVPEEARDHEFLIGGWETFLSICVLFDPPETQLDEFAEYIRWEYSDGRSRNRPGTSVSPIIWRSNSLELEATWMEFYEGLLAALLEKYVHPQGVTTEETMRSVREQHPEIYERWRQRLRDNESRPLIDVQPYHTKEDIDLAFQKLSSRHETRPAPGRDKRDVLTAVQCAILHDRHNHADSTDRRVRKWSFARLAERFGLESSRAAKDHVQLGRELLDQHRGQ